MTSSSFIREFHNLPGNTMRERQHNVYSIFQNFKSVSPNEIDEICANLQPKTHLEKIFRIDFLIYFKRFHELFTEFKGGDAITISKIAKHEWFFQKAFGHIGANDFVNTVLPTMSFCLRLKILRRLRPKEDQSDKIFDALHKRYGIFLATSFLHKCSAKKINLIIANHNIKLTPRQLQTLFDKEPNLITTYFDAREEFDGNTEFLASNPIMLYISRKNPQLFIELSKKYNSNTRVGHRTTRKIVSSCRHLVLDNPDTFMKLLRVEALVRKLGPADTRNLLLKIYPKRSQFQSSNDQILRILRLSPRSLQSKMYQTTFEQTYHEPLGKDLRLINEDYLDLVVDPNEREELGRLKWKEDDDDSYMKYFKPNFVYNELMSKINLMSANDRLKHLEIIIKCCILHSDLETFLAVCDLVAKRLKNDDNGVHEQFVSVLIENEEFIKKLSESHWKLILEICEIILVKACYSRTAHNMKFLYMAYLVKNNKPIKDFIFKYTYLLIYMQSNFLNNRPKTLKNLLMQILELGSPKPDDINDVAIYDCNILYSCLKYNDEHQKNQIEVFKNPRIIKSLIYYIENELVEENSSDWMVKHSLQNTIRMKTPLKEIQTLKDIYFKKFETYGDYPTNLWLLKNEPVSISDHFEMFLEKIVERTFYLGWKELWHLIKKYSHLQLDTKTLDFFTRKLQDTDFTSKNDIINPIMALLPKSTYPSFVQPYLPTTATVDLTVPESSTLYQIQSKVVLNLKYTDTPKETIPLIFKFCQGDYLKFALGPIYSCIERIPENETEPFVQKINEEKALSFKKHAMTLSCIIYDSDTVYQWLKNATVPSLLPTLKYFVKNPSDELWELVENQLLKIEEKDADVFKQVLEFVLELHFKVKFVELVWDILDKYEKKQLKNTLVASLDKKIVGKLSEELCKKIIKDKSLKDTNFAVLLLIHGEQKNRFDIMLNELSDFKRTTNFTGEVRQSIGTFINNLFSTYMRSDGPVHELETSFPMKFNEIFKSTEVFTEFVTLTLLKSKGSNVDDVSRQIIQLKNKLIADFGDFVFNPFVDVLQCTITQICTKSGDDFRICHNIFKLSTCIHDLLLVVKLLPNGSEKDSETETIYDEIMEALAKVDDEIVELHLNLYLKGQ